MHFVPSSNISEFKQYKIFDRIDIHSSLQQKFVEKRLEIGLT